VSNITAKCLGWWAPPVLMNLTPEQVQKPDKLEKYFENHCNVLGPGPCLLSYV